MNQKSTLTRTKIATVMLALAASLSMTACGGGSSSGETKGSVTPVDTSVPANPDVPAVVPADPVGQPGLATGGSPITADFRVAVGPHANMFGGIEVLAAEGSTSVSPFKFTTSDVGSIDAVTWRYFYVGERNLFTNFKTSEVDRGIAQFGEFVGRTLIKQVQDPDNKGVGSGYYYPLTYAENGTMNSTTPSSALRISETNSVHYAMLRAGWSGNDSTASYSCKVRSFQQPRPFKLVPGAVNDAAYGYENAGNLTGTGTLVMTTKNATKGYFESDPKRFAPVMQFTPDFSIERAGLPAVKFQTATSNDVFRFAEVTDYRYDGVATAEIDAVAAEQAQQFLVPLATPAPAKEGDPTLSVYWAYKFYTGTPKTTANVVYGSAILDCN